jgi:acetyl esterase/lipase
MLFVAVFVGLAVACSTTTAQEKPKKPAPPKLTDAAVKTSVEVYRKTPQGELQMHFFFPPDWKATDRRPAMVFFFGGGWKNGSYKQFIPQAEYFASRGLVTASADYRIASLHKTTPEQCVMDAKSAVRWLRANASKLGIDPEKIVASGGSAGGHLAAATALVPGFNDPSDDVKFSCVPNALVLFNPALNLTKVDRPIADAKGKDIAAAISPTKFLETGTPPTILFFGTADAMVSQAREFKAHSTKLGNRAELYTAADMPHGFFNRSPWTEATARQADLFLQSLGYLKGEPSVKTPAEAKLVFEK